MFLNCHPLLADATAALKAQIISNCKKDPEHLCLFSKLTKVTPVFLITEAHHCKKTRKHTASGLFLGVLYDFFSPSPPPAPPHYTSISDYKVRFFFLPRLAIWLWDAGRESHCLLVTGFHSSPTAELKACRVTPLPTHTDKNTQLTGWHM